MTTTDLPRHDEVADADDLLGWDRAEHGLMLDAAADPPPCRRLTLNDVPEA